MLDYVSVTAGTSATLGGAMHIVPPMAFATGYLASEAARIRKALTIPVFVAGRINQPQDADAIIASGQADMCGMTRALICDPQMPAKRGRRRTHSSVGRSSSSMSASLSGPTDAPLPGARRPATPAATYLPGLRENRSAFIGVPPW